VKSGEDFGQRDVIFIGGNAQVVGMFHKNGRNVLFLPEI